MKRTTTSQACLHLKVLTCQAIIQTGERERERERERGGEKEEPATSALARQGVGPPSLGFPRPRGGTYPNWVNGGERERGRDQWPQQDVRSVYTLQETPLQGLRGFSAPRSGRIGLAGWLLKKNVNESHNLYEQNNS